MDRMDDVLKLLNNLIHSTIDEMVKINKTCLSNIKICLQNAQENIEFSQLETKLQKEELQHRKNNSILNIEIDSNQ